MVEINLKVDKFYLEDCNTVSECLLSGVNSTTITLRCALSCNIAKRRILAARSHIQNNFVCNLGLDDQNKT